MRQPTATRQPARTPRDERGSEAIQFILIAATVTVAMVGMWVGVKDSTDTDSTRISSCVQTSDKVLSSC